MKVIREYLVEKFTEDSDPISDMGIGIANRISEVLKSILEEDKVFLFFTIQLTIHELQIYFNSPILRQTRLILTKKDAIDYCNNIFKKLKVHKLFIRPIASGPDYSIGKQDSKVCYKISTDLKSQLKKREITYQRYSHNFNEIRCLFDLINRGLL